jgi:hypothetical protein
MFAWSSPAGMPGQQQAMPFHQPVDALGVDRGQTVGRLCLDKATDRSEQAYTEWMNGLLTFMPDGRYEVKSFATDERDSAVIDHASQVGSGIRST